MSRLLACLLALAAVSAAQPRPPAARTATFRMSGVVVDSSTGLPLAGATVRTGRAEGSDPGQSITTDDDGRFEFRGLTPQKYWLTAERHGYGREAFEAHEAYSTAIAVGPNMQSENLVFRLHPDASISGTVVDEESDPIREAEVMLFQDSVEEGTRATRMCAQATTDDQGRYHFSHLSAATYFVAVSAQPWYAQRPVPMGTIRSFRRESGGNALVTSGFAALPQNLPSDAEQERSVLDVAYPITFYPGVTDADSANPLVLKSGDRASADVTMAAVPAVHLRIKGAGVEPGQSIGANVVQRLFGATLPTAAVVRIGQETEISGLAPGHFEVNVHSYGKNAASWSRAVELSSDEEITSGQPQPSPQVTGVVELDGAAAPGSAFVQLSDPSSQGGAGAQVGEKGEFHLGEAGIRPGDYRVQVFNVPEAAVRSVAAEGAIVNGQSVRIGGASAVRLKIEMSRNLARVDGIALKNGKPAAGVMVVLVPRSAKDNRALFRRDQSDSDGTFSLRFALPGSYTVVALAEGWELQWQDPSVLKPYLKQGESVEVVPGRKYHLEVKVQ